MLTIAALVICASFAGNVIGQSLPARRAEEQLLLKQQENLDRELDKVVQDQNVFAVPATPAGKEEHEKLMRRSQTLNNMRDTIATRLKDITAEIRKTQRDEVAAMFTGPVDVFLDPAHLLTDVTPIARVSFQDQLWLDDKRLVKLKGENGTVWIIDPTKVIAVRSSSAQPAPGSL